MKIKLKRLLYLGYYFYKMNWSLYGKFLKVAADQSAISKLYLVVISIKDSLRYNISLLEFFQFRFYQKNEFEKSSWAGTGFMYEYHLAMNPKNKRAILEDKSLFLTTYKEFVKHEHLTLETLKKKQQLAVDFLKKNEKIVLKSSKGQCGIGIVIMPSKGLAPSGLITKLEETENDIVEAFIEQHEDLKKLSPSGLNTLRLITQLNKENQVEILGAIIRITVNNSVDNLAAGNLASEVDLSSGKITREAVYSDISKSNQKRHPITKEIFQDYQIPFFEEALAMVKEAALRFPQNRSIGWDVAITKTGPELVEANHDWCKLLWQLPINKGMKRRLMHHLEELK